MPSPISKSAPALLPDDLGRPAGGPHLFDEIALGVRYADAFCFNFQGDEAREPLPDHVRRDFDGLPAHQVRPALDRPVTRRPVHAVPALMRKSLRFAGSDRRICLMRFDSCM